jgi:hypothetical protein
VTGSHKAMYPRCVWHWGVISMRADFSLAAARACMAQRRVRLHRHGTPLRLRLRLGPVRAVPRGCASQQVRIRGSP